MGNHNTTIFQPGELEQALADVNGKDGEKTTLWQMFRKGYEDVVDTVIRPKRQFYRLEQLGPEQFCLPEDDKEGKKPFRRLDFHVQNERQLKLACSLWLPQRTQQKVPCLVYCHSNIGSRLDVLRIRDEALSLGFAVLAFDFCGSGLSDGIYVTLGHYEAKDVQAVVAYLSTHQDELAISGICFYAHSMGAAACISYLSQSKCSKDLDIFAVVFDGSFRTINQLSDELAISVQNDGIPAPLWILKAGASLIRTSVKSRANFDMEKVRPIDHISDCTAPTLFLAGEDDKYVSWRHSESLQKEHGGYSQLLTFRGDHYGARPREVVTYSLCFLYLMVQEIGYEINAISDWQKPSILLAQYPNLLQRFCETNEEIKLISAKQ